MSEIMDQTINDELLAAYLDGRLNQEQSENVEHAIENSRELQWTVDRWLEQQTGAIALSKDIPSQSASHNVAPKPLFDKRFWSIAASILICVTVSLPLLFNMGDINPDSGLPMDFPASERYESEIPNIQPPHVTPIDDSENEEKLSYEFEIYKTAAIITWNQPLDSARCIAISDNRQRQFIGYLNGPNADRCHIMVVPLGTFNDSDYPLTMILHLYGRNEVMTDSLTVNL